MNPRLLVYATTFGAMVTLPGCRADCDEGLVQRAMAFLDAHQSCETDSDCVIVHDSCGDLPGGFCGQLTMNREGAESETWGAIEAELDDCGPEECTVCGAALGVGCGDGTCR